MSDKSTKEWLCTNLFRALCTRNKPVQNMASLVAEEQKDERKPMEMVTEDEGRSTEYEVGAGEVVIEKLREAVEGIEIKYHGEPGDMNALSLLKHAPSLELNLVDIGLLLFRIIGKKIAADTAGLYSAEATHKAVTQALERLEKQIGMLLVKDIEAAKQFFATAKKHWLAGNAERAKDDFKEARRLSIEAYSTLNPMEKVVCTELRICAAAGYMSDKELKVEALQAIDELVHDKSLVKELNYDSFGPAWFTDSEKKNHQLLERCYRMINSTIKKLSKVDPYSSLPTEWENALQDEGKNLFTNKVVDKVKDSKHGVGELTATLKGHSGHVYSVAFSSDGTQIASGSDTVKLWDVATGECLNALVGHSGWVSSVAFSSDGKQIASGSWDKTVKLWDVATGKCLKTLVGHSDFVNSVAFSPNGQQIASGSDDKTVKLWNVATGECLNTLEGHSNYVESVAFSPNSTHIASGSTDKKVKIWNVATGECVQTLEGHSQRVWSVAFSQDGTQIASGSDTVKLWKPMYRR